MSDFLKTVRDKTVDFIRWLDGDQPMTTTDLYLSFRQELDEMWVPVVLKRLDVKEIKDGNETVGILCTDGVYIDCLYIVPSHRRKGLGKKAVLEWLKENKPRTVSLHIIKNNKTALKFWENFFTLTPFAESETDILYKGKVKK